MLATKIDKNKGFINLIILEIKHWRNNAYNHKTIHYIENGKHDDHKPCGFKEDSCLTAIMDTQRTETNEGKHG